jgi:hypothetical protein
MKALTLHAEWLPAILRAGSDPRWKSVENRTWKPPASIIGERIALHAGCSRPDKDRVRRVLASVGQGIGTYGACEEYAKTLETLTTGAIVGVATVAGWLDNSSGAPRFFDGSEVDGMPIAPVAENPSPWWFRGQYGWLLADIHPLMAPVPCKGALGLWQVPAHLVQAMEVSDAVSVDAGRV